MAKGDIGITPMPFSRPEKLRTPTAIHADEEEIDQIIFCLLLTTSSVCCRSLVPEARQARLAEMYRGFGCEVDTSTWRST